MAWVSWGGSKECGREVLETYVAGPRSVEDNSGRGKGPPKIVVPEGGGKKERKKYELSNLLNW